MRLTAEMDLTEANKGNKALRSLCLLLLKKAAGFFEPVSRNIIT
jgi:hypothetical protein